MKVIYKYEVPLKHEFEIKLPAGAQVLCCQSQFDVPHIWVIHDLSLTKELRKFRLFGTGQSIDDGIKLSYIGSFQLNEGNFVGHVFEDIAK